MGLFDSVGDFLSAPIKAAETVVNTATGAWNDWTGKTAAEKSAEAASKNTAAQLAWERERAKNAHQWEVEDLENAGLNKIFTTNGSGANTAPINPAMPDYSSLGRKSILDLLPLAINTAQGMANVKLTNAQTISEMANTGLISQNTAKSLAETQYTTTKNKLLNKWGEIGQVLKVAGALGMILYPPARMAYGAYKTAKTATDAARNISKAHELADKGNKIIELKNDNWKKLPSYKDHNHPKNWIRKGKGFYNKITGEYYQPKKL